MMGRTHAISGALVFGSSTFVFTYSPAEAIFAGMLATAAALVPDLDHKGATATKSLGPVSWLVHKLIKLGFGDHRSGTHSIVFAGMIGIGCWQLLSHPNLYTKIGLILLLSIMTAPLVRLFKIRGWLDDLLPPVAYSLVIFRTNLDLSIAPLALMIGCLAHIMGDCLTDRGCPIFWPLTTERYGVGVFTTNGTGEKIATVLFIIGVFAEIVIHGLQWSGVI